MAQPDQKIPKSDVDLTEEELNRIFFGSDSTIKEDVPSNVSDDDFKDDHISKQIKKKTKEIKLPGPVKLKRETVVKPEEVITPPTEDLKSEKRKHGRPVKWTEEMITAKKAENANIAKLKRHQKQEDRRLAQLTGDHPVTEYEKKKRITEFVETQDNIKRHITEKRSELKSILDRRHSPILDRKNKCDNHVYKFSYEEQITNNPVAICVSCSKVQQFTAAEWNSYLHKNRSRI